MSSFAKNRGVLLYMYQYMHFRERNDGNIDPRSRQSVQQTSIRSVARITSELNRMEQLLSAGMVDQGVLTEFRDAVNRVRSTGWRSELAGRRSEGLTGSVMDERIRVTTRLASILPRNWE